MIVGVFGCSCVLPHLLMGPQRWGLWVIFGDIGSLCCFPTLSDNVTNDGVSGGRISCFVPTRPSAGGLGELQKTPVAAVTLYNSHCLSDICCCSALRAARHQAGPLALPLQRAPGALARWARQPAGSLVLPLQRAPRVPRVVMVALLVVLLVASCTMWQ